MMTELIFGGSLWPSLNVAQVSLPLCHAAKAKMQFNFIIVWQFMRKILSLINTKNVLEKIARECNQLDAYNALSPNLKDLLEACLSISPKERPLPEQILQHNLFQKETENYQYGTKSSTDSLLLQCPLKQIYYW